jgi:hypothetical protein
LCRGGSCNQERAWERIAKGHFPARGFKADDAPLDFLASILIFRLLPKETQARSQFGTLTQNIPELGIWGSIPLTEYFPFRVRTPILVLRQIHHLPGGQDLVHFAVSNLHWKDAFA